MFKLSRKTLTKRITFSMLIIGCVNGILPYILSLFNRDPVSELGIVWVEAVVVICVSYFVRGFKDTKAMKEHNLEVIKMERNDEKQYYVDTMEED